MSANQNEGGIFLFDPRKMLPDKDINSLIQDRPLPCGQEVCTPLMEDCLEVGTDVKQAVAACALGMGVRALKDQVAFLQQKTELHQGIIDKLSIDPETGILTRAAQKLLFEDMAESGTLAEMRVRGYALQFLFGDIDLLKAHNTLGDHAGGDAVIKLVADTMRGLFRREYDVVFRSEPSSEEDDIPNHGYIKHTEMAIDAVDEDRQYYAVSRFNAGDEISVMSFVPPDTDRRQQIGIYLLQEQVNRVAEAFEGLFIGYPLNEKVTEEKIQEIRQNNPSFTFSINDEGIVTAPVSVTFAILGIPVPATWEEFDEASKMTDSVVNGLKVGRAVIETRGAPLSLVTPPR